MTRNLRGCSLIASMVVVVSATSSEACDWVWFCTPAPCGYSGHPYAGPTGQHVGSGGYTTTPTGQHPAAGGYTAPATGQSPAAGGYTTPAGGSYSGGYPAGTTGYPAGYRYGRPYNPGGIGGPASGLGVRPGVGFGGLGRGR
jgi:hypothetical protein